MVKKYLQLTLIAVMLAGVLTACGKEKESTASPTTEPSTTVSLQLAWVHTMEYSGFYLAQDEGLYAAENLQLDLREGGFDAEGNFIFSIDHVTSGNADFGVIGGDQLLKARSEGAPLVAIAVLYQRSPVVLMSLAENNIRTPNDLIGKSLAIDLETATGLSFVALMNSQDIPLDQINIVNRTDFTNTLLTNKEVEVLDGFITNQPIALKQEGFELSLILPSDYGVDLYTNVIYTTEEMITTQPDVVERFLSATLRGFQAAVDNPQKAADLAVARNDTLLAENELAGMQASVPLLNPVDSHIGAMTPEVWSATYQLLLDEDIIQKPFDVTTAYTLTFLDKIYAE